MSTPKCRGYEGQHDCGERYYVVIAPDGRLLHFCDSDCIREFFESETSQFVEAAREPLVACPECGQGCIPVFNDGLCLRCHEAGKPPSVTPPRWFCSECGMPYDGPQHDGICPACLELMERFPVVRHRAGLCSECRKNRWWIMGANRMRCATCFPEKPGVNA